MDLALQALGGTEQCGKAAGGTGSIQGHAPGTKEGPPFLERDAGHQAVPIIGVLICLLPPREPSRPDPAQAFHAVDGWLQPLCMLANAVTRCASQPLLPLYITTTRMPTSTAQQSSSRGRSGVDSAVSGTAHLK
jgi:hypothetical protein